MSTPQISKEEAEKRITAIEQKLTEGFTPPNIAPPPGIMGAIRAAAVENGMKPGAGNSWLKAAIRTLDRQPDWSLYRPVEQKRPQIIAPDIPDGYRLKGTSTLVDMQTGEPRLEWVKTEADRERQKELMLEFVASMNEKIKPVERIKKPKPTDADLMTCYPISDFHLGMLAWSDETRGEDFDLAIAEDLLKGAMSYLVEASPSCERSLIVVLGDFFHYDSMVPQTPQNRNPLDADGRAPKMIRAGVRLLRYAVEMARLRHADVHVIIATGNHDPVGAIWSREALAALYEKEPRVTVDTSPSMFHYHRWGKNLIGVNHGYGVKLADLPKIMAADVPEDWGQTEHRVFWTGDKHHREKYSGKDFEACEVEQFRVMIPNDAYHAGKGYRSMQSMHAIVRHKEHGELSRITVNPKMLQ